MKPPNIPVWTVIHMQKTVKVTKRVKIIKNTLFELTIVVDKMSVRFDAGFKPNTEKPLCQI